MWVVSFIRVKLRKRTMTLSSQLHWQTTRELFKKSIKIPREHFMERWAQ